MFKLPNLVKVLLEKLDLEASKNMMQNQDKIVDAVTDLILENKTLKEME